MRRTIKVTVAKKPTAKTPTVTVAKKTPVRRAGRVLRAVSLGLVAFGLVGAAVAVVGARVLATTAVETDGEKSARLNGEIRAALADLRAEVAVTQKKADALAAANAEAREAFAQLADAISKKAQ